MAVLEGESLKTGAKTFPETQCTVF